jgi:hypothetical protein
MRERVHYHGDIGLCRVEHGAEIDHSQIGSKRSEIFESLANGSSGRIDDPLQHRGKVLAEGGSPQRRSSMNYQQPCSLYLR